jgi:VWFA-related protein
MVFMNKRLNNLVAASVFRILLVIVLTSLSVLAQGSEQQKPPLASPAVTNTQEPQEQPGTIRLPTSIVTLPVIVTDPWGRFIPGLKQDDFIVKEDGTLQKVELFSSMEESFSVALLIDTSRSTARKLKTIEKAAMAFVKQLLPNDRVMIVTFDEKVRFINDFTNSQSELEKAIKSVESSYSTSLYDAIHLTVTEKMARVKGRKAIVVLTDGVDTFSKQATYESALELVARAGIISYAIQYETRNAGSPLLSPMVFPGNNFAPSARRNFLPSSFTQQPSQTEQQKSTSDQKETATPNQTGERIRQSTQIYHVGKLPRRDPYLVATDFLRSLAERSGARYLRAENIENTSFYFSLIADELRHQYTLAYYPSNVKADGTYRTITVGLKPGERGVVIRTRQGYTAPKESPEKEK